MLYLILYIAYVMCVNFTLVLKAFPMASKIFWHCINTIHVHVNHHQIRVWSRSFLGKQIHVLLSIDSQVHVYIHVCNSLLPVSRSGRHGSGTCRSSCGGYSDKSSLAALQHCLWHKTTLSSQETQTWAARTQDPSSRYYPHSPKGWRELPVWAGILQLVSSRCTFCGWLLSHWQGRRLRRSRGRRYHWTGCSWRAGRRWGW